MAKAAIAEEPAQPLAVRKIHPSRFREAEVSRNVWVVVPEHDTSFEDLLQPSYWAHIAEKVRPTDRIEVYAEDGSYFAELIVRTSTRLSVSVALLRKVDLETQIEMSSDDGFEVKWRGPYMKHSVIRSKDGASVQTGFDTKEAAIVWLGQNARNLAA